MYSLLYLFSYVVRVPDDFEETRWTTDLCAVCAARF